MNLAGKKILVTGGAGFIGSHTVDVLVGQGAEVVVVDNCSTGKRENLNPAATFYDMNLGDEALKTILHRERPAVIYHFAHFVRVPESLQCPFLDMDVLMGTVRMLECAARIGVERIVFSSSGFLYGNTLHLPATEELPVVPITPYVISKHAIEQYLECYRSIYGIPYTVVRYAAIYGPRQVMGAMADYIRKLSMGAQAEIWGDGTKTRDYVFIDDAVRANLLALDVSADFPKPIFNIGTGRETMLNTLYWKIAEILGVEPKPIYHRDRPGEQMRYCVDNTRARTHLGWNPKWSLEEGLPRTVEANRVREPCFGSQLQPSRSSVASGQP